jgi:hypothetical protein
MHSPTRWMTGSWFWTEMMIWSSDLIQFSVPPQPRNSFCASLNGNTVIQNDNKHEACYVNRFLRLMVYYQSYTCEPNSCEWYLLTLQLQMCRHAFPKCLSLESYFTFADCTIPSSYMLATRGSYEVTATHKGNSHLCTSTSTGLSVYLVTIKVSSRGVWLG